MAVSNQTIIDKMIQELYQAKEVNGKEHWNRHIANVQMLCDLLLESEGAEQVKQEAEKENGRSISAEEMEVMMGAARNKKKRPDLYKQVKIDDAEANGDSIFDF